MRMATIEHALPLNRGRLRPSGNDIQTLATHPTSLRAASGDRKKDTLSLSTETVNMGARRVGHMVSPDVE